MYTIILFYKYTDITDPEKLKLEQKMLCEKLGLKGRMIIACEGINATLEGETEAIAFYMQELTKHKEFADVHFKKSEGNGNAFPKLSIKVRPEIVSGQLGALDINPQEVTGKYITAKQLHEWITSKEKEFYIVDMRNDYEQAVGHFEGFVSSGMKHFKDLPDVLPKIAHLKDKTIVTVCTGGVRCEKASGFLVKNGFSDVYQLYGGIVTYMEEYPNEAFQGSLYVFDNRIIMGFNRDDPKRKIVGTCVVCQKPSEHFINCRDSFCDRHFICCEACLGNEKKILCPMGCRDYSQEHPETVTTA
jgi:UPF0176 protein